MVKYQSTPDFYNEYISHHGILGQKWGKQNGPPYPLGSDVSTGSRLKKGADGKGSVNKKTYKNRPDNLSELNLNKQNSSKKMSNKELDKILNEDYSILPKDKKETKKELKNVQKDLRKVAPELNSYFLKSKEGKDYQTHEEETGSFDKEYMNNKMKDLASKDSHFKDLYETYNSLDKQRYDLEMQLIKNKKSVREWIDDRTITREPKSETSTPRFGEKTKDGKIIRTSSDLINEAAERGAAEYKKRSQNAINNNQDMFNDLLYNSKYSNNTKEDVKTYEKEIKRVAKEYGINKKALQKEVEANFNQREKEISDKKRKENINKMLSNARSKDMYSINFLEATQNSPWVEAHITGKMSDSAYKNKMLQEYKKYLEDPEKYWTNI